MARLILKYGDDRPVFKYMGGQVWHILRENGRPVCKLYTVDVSLESWDILGKVPASQVCLGCASRCSQVVANAE